MEIGKTYKTKLQTEEKFTIEKIDRNNNGDVTRLWGWYENSPNLKMCPLSPERLQIEKENMKDKKLDTKERINYTIQDGYYVGKSVNLGCICQAKSLDELKTKMKCMVKSYINLFTEIIEQDDCFEVNEISADEFLDNIK